MTLGIDGAQRKPLRGDTAKNVLLRLPVENVEAIIAEIYRARKDVTAKGVQREIDRLARQEERKRAKVEQAHLETIRRRNAQPFAIVEDFYEDKYRKTNLLGKYTEWNVKQLGNLVETVKNYSPDRRHHRQIKSDVLVWLRNLIIEKQAQTEPEPPEEEPKSVLKKAINVFRGH